MFSILALGATARLTRFIVLDDLGHWTIKGPFQRHAAKAEAEAVEDLVAYIAHVEKHADVAHVPAAIQRRERLVRATDPEDPEPLTIREKISHGLNCPYCVSTWIGMAVVGVGLLSRKHPATRAIAATIAGGLTASYISGAIVHKEATRHD